MYDTLAELDDAVIDCRACPRLVAWREQVAREKKPEFQDETYWGRPVPGFGPADARMLIAGLAPAAHGANRTGRMFTGDRSGDALFKALYATGLASKSTASSREDGMRLFGVRMTAPVRCAPPQNKPTPAERDRCRQWFVHEVNLLAPTLRSVFVLGGFGWQAILPALAAAGWEIPRPRPTFGHGAHVELLPTRSNRTPLHLHGCYHVSPHNVNTGRLTPAMLEQALRTAATTADLPHY